MGCWVFSYAALTACRPPQAIGGRLSRVQTSTPDKEKTNTLAQVCESLKNDDLDDAREILHSRYPFTPVAKMTRRYNPRDCMRVFFRDGFVDRYAGTQLIHPGALRLLSVLLPDEFPFHPNWATSKTHFAFWELFPTIDHVVPVTRGGLDNQSNWVTTSMLRNSAKSQWTLDELGWSLIPASNLSTWDGMTDWFVNYLTGHPTLQRDHEYLRKWFSATLAVRAEWGNPT